MHSSKSISTLFSHRILLPPETLSSSLLGYILLREKLLEQLLGESEAPILYWLGKELGASVLISDLTDIEHLFEQLDFGQVELITQSASLLRYRLIHRRLQLIALHRLERMLQLETGFLAGLTEQALQCSAAATVNVLEQYGTVTAIIQIGLEREV